MSGRADVTERLRRREQSVLHKATPRFPAVGFCQGTPLRNEIEARGAGALAKATDVCADEIARRFGRETVDGKIQAHVVTVGL